MSALRLTFAALLIATTLHAQKDTAIAVPTNGALRPLRGKKR